MSGTFYKDSAQSPLYVKYYDQVLALEKAGKPTEDLKNIAVENEDVREQINHLTVPQAGMGEVQLLAFSQSIRKPSLGLTASNSPLSLTLQTIGAHNEILSEKKLEKSTAQTKILALQSGN